MCDSCEEVFASSGGKGCVQSRFLMSLLMGVWEAEYATCHFEMKGSKQMTKSFPCLPSRTGWGWGVHGLFMSGEG